MRLAVALVLGLWACESGELAPLRIDRVTPGSWDLSSVPDYVVVEGEGFQSSVVSDLSSGSGVAVRDEFRGTLGGETLDLELVYNGRLRFVPPAALGSGSHDLVITAPDGRRARAPDPIRVGAGLDLPSVVVSTSSDETDISPTDPNPTEADAGAEVSLREALLIANAASEPHAIRFGEDVVITITPAAGELPAITRDGTVIDGSGADVVITGAGATDFHGLVVTANDVTVASIRIESFDGSDNHCLTSTGDRLRLIDCDFFACDDPGAGSGSQVAIDDGDGVVVRSCLFFEAGRDGLRFDSPATNGVIAQNRFFDAGDDGLNLLGPGHVVADNIMRDSGGSGIEIVFPAANDIRLERNLVVRSGWGVAEPVQNGAGIMVKWGPEDVQIVDCEFEENQPSGIQIWRNDTSGITVSRAAFRATQLRAIHLYEGGNGAILPPLVTDFDGISVSGNAMGADGGIVEIYAVAANGDATYAVSATTAAGAWSATLPEYAPTVAATLTLDGSTSELSAFTSP